jgi:hypothetical protein
MIGLLASAKACINHGAVGRPALDQAASFRPDRETGKDHGRQGEVCLSHSRVLVASCAVTYVNIGPRVDFVRRWLSAFLVGWPVAAVTAYLAFPVVRSATVRLIHLIEGR